ncbi:biotin--[acetyl-CoA-carboxylase] ligase [Myxosarcina sp. GI1]|uniref:biotin--[acetyl-CoA-carboxylase] ligase n=1 Tax=Myxosarcina sp. GI1 TaxID=1541065 RepID=UPI000567676C|nr:biotin--[acetyl-CoA-carboxylase] ligase [Myxosarcina sp. GI1]
MVFNRQTYQQVFLNLGKNHNKIIAPIPLHIFESIPSTNQKLWQLIERDSKISLGVIALQQTAGKGQWGKQWLSPSGGMYLSVSLFPDLALNNNFHLIMATAWGIATTLRSYNVPVSIKWSNDLVLSGRKLGGIKIETRAKRQRITQAVVGVGINWTNPVPAIGINLLSYRDRLSSLEELVAIATYGIIFGYQHYLKVGAKQLVARYSELLINLGQQINIDGDWGTVTGVTTEGKLIVRTETATEVYLTPGQISLGYEF